MSIKIMSRVWEESKHKGTNLLLLLAIADNADDGGYCWPGIEYLRKKIRMTPRSVINSIQRLEQSGELVVVHNRRTGNKYLVTVGMSEAEIERGHKKLGCEKFSSEAECTSEVQNIHIRSEAAIAQEPSITINEPSYMPREDAAQQSAFIEPPPTKPNGQAHFLALAEICQVDLKLMTTAQRNQLGQSSKAIKENGDPPEKITNFGKWWSINDWRGKQGQPPLPHQVREEWGKFKKSPLYNGASMQAFAAR